MDINNQDALKLFMSDATQDTRNNIVSLDQRLKALHEEIETKIRASKVGTEEQSELFSERLTTLKGEVDKAIEGMEGLVNLMLNEDEEFKTAFYQSGEMNELNKIITEHLEKITRLEDKF